MNYSKRENLYTFVKGDYYKMDHNMWIQMALKMSYLKDPRLSSVQLLSRVQLFVTPWTAAQQASHHQLPEFTQTHVHWVGDAIQPSHPLSSPSPPTFDLSQHQGLFKWISFCIKWLKYWSFSFIISPSNEYSGLIYFRMDWFDLAGQGTLKSLLQHHSSKASIYWHLAFFIV